MDWSKAKSILIISFIITNLILAYVLISGDKYEETTIKDSFIEDVIQLLDKKDIKLGLSIPREIPSLVSLTVEYENIDSYRVNEDFFKGLGSIESKGTGITEINYGEESILIRNRKTLLYQNKNTQIKYNNMDKELAIDLALSFIKEKGIDTSDMKLSKVIEEENLFKIEYTKVYEGRYIERANTLIEVDQRGIFSLERMWLNVVEVGEKPRYISTAPKSILSLLTMEEAYGKTIEDISLTYYFDPEKQEFVNNPTDAKRGNTVPGWRVVFSDGTKFILDDY